MFKRILQALGIIRGDLNKLLSFGESFANQLDQHSARAYADASAHYDTAQRHSELGDDASDEAARADRVAKNVRGLFT